jgi:hypothetical protein
MVNGHAILLQIEGSGNDNVRDNNIDRNGISNGIWITFHLSDDTESDKQVHGSGGGNTVKPAWERFLVAGVDDGRPNDTHWEVSSSFLQDSFAEGFGKSVSVGVFTEDLFGVGDELLYWVAEQFFQVVLWVVFYNQLKKLHDW